MGTVNVGITKFCNCHRTLESIHPSFDSTTPIYLVIDEMKYDKAEYDVNIEYSQNNVSRYLWKTYPELGNNHIEITTSINSESQIVRTVKCTCESGRVYTNIFTKRHDSVYNGRFNISGREVYWDDVSILLRYAYMPTLPPETLGLSEERYMMLLTMMYGKNPIPYGGSTYAGLGELTPNKLISDGHLLEFAWCLAQSSVKLNAETDTIVGLIPELTMDEKIALLSKGSDVQTIPYIMLLGLTNPDSIDMGEASTIYGWLGDVYPMSGLTPTHSILDTVATYILTSRWAYTGWECVERGANTISEYDDDERWFHANMCDDKTCKLYVDDISSKFYSQTPHHTNNHNTNLITDGSCVSLALRIVSMRGFEDNYIVSHIPFKPVVNASIRYHISKLPYSGCAKVLDVFSNFLTLNHIRVIGDPDIDKYSDIVIELRLNTNDGCVDIEVIEKTTSYNRLCDNDIPNIINRSTLDILPTQTVTSSNKATNHMVIIDTDAFTNSYDECLPFSNIEIKGDTLVNTASDGVTVTSFEGVAPTIYTSNHNIMRDFFFTNMRYDETNANFSAYIPPSTYGNNDYMSTSYIPIPHYNDTNTFSVSAVSYTASWGKSPLLEIFKFDSDKTLIDTVTVYFSGTTSTYGDIEFGDDTEYIVVGAICLEETNISIVATGLDHCIRASSTYNLSTPLYSLDNIYDRLYRKNGIWVVERNTKYVKITAKDFTFKESNSSDNYISKTFPTFDDGACAYFYDVDASSPDSGIYIFHLSRNGTYINPEINSIGYGRCGIPVATNKILSVNAKTDVDIPIGSEVLNGATPFTDVDTYAITFQDNKINLTEPTNMKGTAVDGNVNIVTGCRYTVIEVNTDIDFDRTTDIFGNPSAWVSSKILTIACKLDANIGDPVTAFFNKLKASPIYILYAPRFEYNPEYGKYVSPRYISKNSASTIPKSTNNYIIRDSFVNADLDSLRAYPNGIINISTNSAAPFYTIVKYRKKINLNTGI